jgi:hypothetical protein
MSISQTSTYNGGILNHATFYNKIKQKKNCLLEAEPLSGRRLLVPYLLASKYYETSQ